MYLITYIIEAITSVRANKLRSFLTSAMIAIGIMALVGIMTAIDAVQDSINSGMDDLGVSNFTITDLTRRRGKFGRKVSKKNTITYEQLRKFKKLLPVEGKISVQTPISSSLEIKRLSKKTTPNYGVVGIDEMYFSNNGYSLKEGRSFSSVELSQGQNVAIIAKDVRLKLFDKNEDPIDKSIGFKGKKYRVIGVLEEKGGIGEGDADRQVFIPLLNANKFAAQQLLNYTATVNITDPRGLDYAMSEARGILRIIRKDQLGKPDSFEIKRNDSLNSEFDQMTFTLRIGGLAIAVVTLLGASIGLMNIMMVSVTERTREIGIRKALGATPTAIRQQFLLEAIFICLIGGAVGAFLGAGIGNVIAAFLESESFVLPWVWIIISIFVCVAVGVISGYYPARKASRLDPIESLRFE
ncbi:ABC transporter permease [Flammeovirga kamogawensis]|uniref:ABC transporter permease n=1 Tax=Flammeovirga kamogawensis TaxID=373891 RepID=A0ABX8GUT3_9BACT|nr:ABC transporter permease [Flammeovirga kamogawensis]MBB6459895.1 putative ABC transport system permease protein [Flammeovirga kamogawensis]QWG07052.1 ABC transporter permease [Flammeovirga kamogawensis]TRX68874.1 FtsX-like permease family protein [Flammeovirga kamogawensis]